jgi:hypothetical protein
MYDLPVQNSCSDTFQSGNNWILQYVFTSKLLTFGALTTNRYG